MNAIAPTFTRTVLAEEFLSDPANSAWVLSRIPMKRLGELDDLFGLIIQLQPDPTGVFLKLLKDHDNPTIPDASVRLDPNTFLALD